MSPTASQHDAAIWRTFTINDLIDCGRFHEVPDVPTTFPGSLAEDEKIVATGPFVLHEFVSLGNGSYTHDSGFFFASGPYGTALTAGVAIGRAVGNNSRRRAAADAATPRWCPVDDGLIHVSDSGFYLQSRRGLLPWGWPAVTSAQLIGPGQLWMSGNSTQGPVQWIVDSDWAELVLTLWARVQHPRHPQFEQGTWVPEGWAARIAAGGYALPPDLSGRWGRLMLGSGNAGA